MIAYREALRLVVERTPALPAERTPLSRALDRVLARDVAAPGGLPRFASSSMDGYALSSRDTRGASPSAPVALRLARRAAHAGSRAGPPVAPGGAVRIMTGAPLPRGADAVLPKEEARVRGGTLHVPSRVRAGTNVRRPSEDFRKGERVAAAGTRVHAGLIALLSALGVRRVRARRPPRIAVVVTGSELRGPGPHRLPEGAVRDSHAAFLRAALREFSIEPALVARVPDVAPRLRRALGRALARSDLVIVTGGVSVGDRDLVKPVLARLGVRRVFWGVAQQPGKPLYFGRRGRTAVFGLPGNPASTIVCYCEYVRPAIRKMLGEGRCLPEELRARAVSLIRPAADRTRLLRGRLGGRAGAWTVAVASSQGSHLLRPFAGSDCLVIVPPAAGRPRGGRPLLQVHPLPWRRA